VSPRRILSVAAALFVLAAVYGVGLIDRLDPYSPLREVESSAESALASDAVAQAAGFRPEETVVALVDGSPRRAGEVAGELLAEPGIAQVITPRAAPELRSTDGGTAALVAMFSADVTGHEQEETALRILDRYEGQPDVAIGGQAAGTADGLRMIEKDLPIIEALTFPVLFLLSLWFFRSLVAAALPPLLGAMAIAGTLAGLRALSEVMDVSVFAMNLVTALALGLSIDFSLFMVSRFREELARGAPDPLRATLRTAGRTVLISALTIAAALSSLLVFPQPFLRSMAVGGMLVAALACLLALVVLPAILRLLGERVNAYAPMRLQRAAQHEARPLTSGFWYRISRAVIRRPGTIALLTSAALLALALPALNLQVVSIDTDGLPRDAAPRLAQDRLERDFAPSLGAPITVVAPPGTGPATMAAAVEGLDGVAAVSPAARPLPGGASLLTVYPRDRAFDAGTLELVRDLRALPGEHLVGGQSAMLIDERATLRDRAPLALAICALATCLLVFVLTGSVVLPVKTLLINLLTVGSAFGVLVLVFQDGRFQDVLGYASEGGVIGAVLVFVAALAFGLSTDYGVFVLSRMKEARALGLPEREAVAVGLERTGRLVTAAALILAVALGALAAGRVLTIKETAVGLVAAIVIDAAIVRSLLVPALMGVLGRWNWWAPAPLARLHARIEIRESDERPFSPPAAPAPSSAG
jgi:uncharacterized membrane protein YdfJ with MMPL/SSD domain